MSSQEKPKLRVFMTDVYFSVTEKLLEQLKTRFGTDFIDFEIEQNIKKANTCDIIIGDRHGIPYKSLRAATERAPGHSLPLINFFEGAQRLTLKVSMAKLLHDFPSAGFFCPKTFIIEPTSFFSDQQQQNENDQDGSTPSTPTGDAVAAPPVRKSALPSKAERMAMVAAKKQQQETEEKKGDASCPFCVLAKVKSSTDDQRDALAEEMKRHPDFVWIAKPTAGSKGVGIIVSRDFEEITQHVETFNPATALSHDQTYGASASDDGTTTSTTTITTTSSTSTVAVKKSSRTKFVVQRYIDRPLLVRGNRKFDIRVWCALSSPTYEVHVFSEGSCRTASAPYTGTSNLKNQFEHVTNHDLQQYAPGYGEFEAGNEMWYAELASFLEETYSGEKSDQVRQKYGKHIEEVKNYLIPTVPFTTAAKAGEKSGKLNIFEDLVRPQFHHVIVQSFLAAREILEIKFERFQAFQIYGFDLMLDDELNVHLLEINGAPGVAQDLFLSCVDGSIDELMAPRNNVLSEAITKEKEKSSASAESRKGVWEKVFSAK